MRNYGRVLLRLTSALGLVRLRETVVAPAIADMQHERAEASSNVARRWMMIRGYWSILAGVGFYATLQPARYLREDWIDHEGAGRRLVRHSWRASAMVVCAFAAFVGIMTATSRDESWRVPPGSGSLFIAGFIFSIIPLALAVGVGWTLTRDRSGSRAALTIGALASLLLFASADMIIPRASEGYRAAAYRERTGRDTPPNKTSREMTFRELTAATALAEANVCARPPGMCACVNGQSAASLGAEWHRRLSMPALALSFALLATGLSRTGRRLLLVPGLVLTYFGSVAAHNFGVMNVGGGAAPAFAAWVIHLLPLTASLILRLSMSAPESTPSPQV